MKLLNKKIATGLLLVLLFTILQGCGTKENGSQSTQNEQNSEKVEWVEAEILEITRDFDDDTAFAIRNLIVTETLGGQRIAYYEYANARSAFKNNLDNPVLTMQVGDSVLIKADGSEIKMNQ